jgi:hypothetical protein
MTVESNAPAKSAVGEFFQALWGGVVLVMVIWFACATYFWATDMKFVMKNTDKNVADLHDKVDILLRKLNK